MAVPDALLSFQLSGVNVFKYFVTPLIGSQNKILQKIYL